MMIINGDSFDPKNSIVFYGDVVTKIRLNYMMKRPSIFELSTIDAFKQTFGRQKKTWIGGSDNFRFFIWTFRIDDSVLYAFVHNEKGVCWEYPVGTNKSKLMEIFCEIYKRLPRKNESDVNRS